VKRFFFCVFIPFFATSVAAAPFYRTFVPDGKGGIEITGDWLQLLIPLSGLVYSAAIGDYQGSWQVTKTYVYAAGTTDILKKLVGAPRPYQSRSARGDSFPSGHTTHAFSGATFWQRRYGWEIGAPMYVAAAFTGYSRIHANAHYWRDVAAGAAIGIGFGYLMTTSYIPPDTQISVLPMNGGAMLRFSTGF